MFRCSNVVGLTFKLFENAKNLFQILAFSQKKKKKEFNFKFKLS